MHYTATDTVLVITAICTGIVSIIAAWRANNAAALSFKSNVKLDQAKDKLEEVSKATNGNLTKLEDHCLALKQGNKYLRAMLVEFIKITPKEEVARITEEVDSRGLLKKQLLESPLFNFRETHKFDG